MATRPRPFRMMSESGGVIELDLYGVTWFLTIEDETGRARGQITLSASEAAALSPARRDPEATQ